jgi:hypothetical protein
MTPRAFEPTFRTDDAAKLAQLLASAAEIGVELMGIKGRAIRPPVPSEAADEEYDEDADTILFPAKPDGIAFLDDEVAWQSVRLSKRSRAKIEDGTVQYGAAYAAAPGPMAVVRIAGKITKVVPSTEEPDKWRIEFEKVEKIDPIPYGGVNVRNIRFVSMAKLRKAHTLADL